MKYTIKEFTRELIHDKMLDHYVRTQKVESHYYFENGTKLVRPISFTDDWSKEVRIDIINNYFRSKNHYAAGVLHDGEVIAFYVISRALMKENNHYLQLAHLQVSAQHRKKGLGKKLFYDAVLKAKHYGAKKLYISAHSAYETQQFYLGLGCVDALWKDPESVEQEPYDIQMEYQI